MNDRRRAFAAVRWTAASTVGRAVLQVAQVSLLARLLRPQDFGLMAIVIAVFGMAQLMADFGLGAALIHHRDVSQEQLESLFWLNLLVALALGVTVLAVGPLLAWSYREPELARLVALMSPSFVLTALGQQLRAQAEKRLDFRSIAFVELGGQLTSLVAATGFAWAGAGVYAFVAGALCSAAMSSSLAWLVLAHGWRPRLRFRIDEVRSLLGFGGWQVSSNLVGTINAQLDVLIGARTMGGHLLGIFQVPRDLVMRLAGVVNPVFSRVSFPLMAETQHESERLAGIYGKVLQLTAGINFPAYALIAVEGEELVRVLFGPAWAGGVDALKVLCIWAAIRSTGNPVGSLLAATGKVRLGFHWNLWLLPLLAAAVAIGSSRGPTGLAYGLLCAQVLLLVPSWYYLVRPCCGMPLRAYAAILGRPALAAGLAVACARGVILQLSSTPGLAQALGVCVLFAPVYLAASWLVNRPFVRELALLPRALAGASSSNAL
ncbi:MAG: MOP flippase family protein [Polyangiales bacterium]